MDNVSKGLIIAGTIVTTMFLITLTIYIVNNNDSATQATSQISEVQLMTFNNEYILYGGKQKGENVKNLLKKAAINNETLWQKVDTKNQCVCIRTKCEEILRSVKDEEIRIALNGTRWYGIRYPSNINDIAKLIRTSKTYTISFNYNKSGYIWEIWIND